ncbi:MAG TPA: Crp/Fnr family transcriptional regulator [Bradyrhizobium sp.]|jgi:CRP-like cAMP-binding protein|uniref:Crp/Fnr family transcriptional regulator n=1 Tax=Bradyrhizobium sp. TaxID=376 RepID=UPI002C6DC14E|nr:Crp/Fnr family transcriptional regulator [Bradyrhizobium sp.]HTB00426.1 Crp/Fnr family transcriptional regulator [Bradyrhizobium sp.]
MDSAAQSSNVVLASLSADDFEAIRPHLRTVELSPERRLIRLGEAITQVYLPHSGVVSFIVELAAGERVEVAMVGRDSVVGASAALGILVGVTEAVVLLPGTASMIDVDRFRAAVERSEALRTTLVRHGQALFVQAQQTAGCNASHSVEARLARWLLRVRDLSGSNHFTLTQELMAQMIGARRNSVSIVANTLQQARYIRYSRGRVEILDLDGLTGLACECYGAVKAQYERLRLPM